MTDEHRERIKERVIICIQQFKEGVIDCFGLTSSLVGNIGALDNLDSSVENALIRLCCELETIYFTQHPDAARKAMLEEVSRFEPFIDKI